MIRVLSLGIALVALMLNMTLAIPVTQVQLLVDATVHHQTMEGFGATLTPFELDGIFKAHDPSQPQRVSATAEQRRDIASLLFEQLGLTRVRLFPEGFEPVNDNDEPGAFNPQGFDWSRVDALTDFARLAQPYGLQNGWASFGMDTGARQAWLRTSADGCPLDPTKVDEAVEWLLAAALRFRDAGVELPYMTIINEPDLCPKIEIKEYLAIARGLGARLQAEGLSTRLVVSDGWLPENALRYMRAALNDPQIRPYVGALAYHAYDGYDNLQVLEHSAAGLPPHGGTQARGQIRELAAQYGLPVWMTEVCYCVSRQASAFELLRGRLNHLHDELTLADVSAFDAMNLFFIERPGIYDELVHVYFRADGALERYEISPYGYMLGHYSRFVPTGSVRLQADSSDPRVRATAFARPDGHVVVVVLNNNPVEVQLEMAFNGLSPQGFSALTSDASAYWQEGLEVSVHGQRANIIAPPLSVTTYVEQ